jgi:hypothetical protein
MADHNELPSPPGSAEGAPKEPVPIAGPPISAAPSDGGERLDTFNFFSSKPEIKLETTQILQPYAVRGATTFWDDERAVKFKVIIKEATRLTIVQVRKNSIPLTAFRNTVTNLNKAGTHEYRFSGFSDALVFDTEVLKQPELSADILTDKAASSSQHLATKQVYCPWMDLKIDDRAKKIEVKVYVSFSNSPVQDKQIDPANFTRMKDLIRDGIGLYWSRPRVRVAWSYEVITKAIERDSDAIKFILTKPTPLKNIPMLPDRVRDFFAEQQSGERCFNPGVLAGSDALPIIFYYDGPLDPDWIKETGAHEFGHSILLRGFDKQTSITHKGTSTESQVTIDGAYRYPPAPNEIDLMKYSRDPKPADFYARVKAAEEDVLALLSLARIQFSPK